MHLSEFDTCPMHSALQASGIGRIKIQCTCIGFVLFHAKSKCAFINPLIILVFFEQFLVICYTTNKQSQLYVCVTADQEKREIKYSSANLILRKLV